MERCMLFNNSTAITFTQQKLETGQLVYTHTNNDTREDSFRFSINILPADDEPPLVCQISPK